MCRGHIAENELVEVPPDYEMQQQNDNNNDETEQPWYSSTKVSLPSFLVLLVLLMPWYLIPRHLDIGRSK